MKRMSLTVLLLACVGCPKMEVSHTEKVKEVDVAAAPASTISATHKLTSAPDEPKRQESSNIENKPNPDSSKAVENSKPQPIAAPETEATSTQPTNQPQKIVKNDIEWRTLLTPEQYEVTRQKGTECRFTGKYYNYKGNAVFHCVCCGNPLFTTENKYESGTGWPSFWKPVSDKSVELEQDFSHGIVRVEVKCSRCDAHLGHVFEDGPLPTGLRYCINSVALKAVEKEKK